MPEIKNPVPNNQVASFFQISAEIDPSNNWTLIKVDNTGLDNGTNQQMSSIQEETDYDSLFSNNSLKSNHSSSNKELCTCLQFDDSDDLDQNQIKSNRIKKNPHRVIQRVSSYPRCHPGLDPHRFRLDDRSGLKSESTNQLLRHLPTIPPYSSTEPTFDWHRKPQNLHDQPQSFDHEDTIFFHEPPRTTGFEFDRYLHIFTS